MRCWTFNLQAIVQHVTWSAEACSKGERRQQRVCHVRAVIHPRHVHNDPLRSTRRWLVRTAFESGSSHRRCICGPTSHQVIVHAARVEGAGAVAEVLRTA
jgi:hypothetical protein